MDDILGFFLVDGLMTFLMLFGYIVIMVTFVPYNLIPIAISVLVIGYL